MTVQSVVLLGGEGCGKTSLALRFVLNKYSEAYDPHVSDKYKREEVVNGEVVVFEISDVCGCQEFRELVIQECESADGFLFVIDATDMISIDEVQSLRKEALQVSDKASVLVASKCDSDNVIDSVVERARKLAAEWKVPLVECSSKLNFGVSEAFHQLARTISKFDEDVEPDTDTMSVPQDLIPSGIGLVNLSSETNSSPQAGSRVAFSSPVTGGGTIELLESTTDNSASGTETHLESLTASTNGKVKKKKKKKKRGEEKVVFSETSPLFSLGGLLSMKAFRGSKKYTLPRASGILEEPSTDGQEREATEMKTTIDNNSPPDMASRSLATNVGIVSGSVSPPAVDIFHQVDMLADLLGDKKNENLSKDTPDSDTTPALLHPKSPLLVPTELTPRDDSIHFSDTQRGMSHLVMNDPISPTGGPSTLFSTARNIGARSPPYKSTTPSLQPGGEHLLGTSGTQFSSSDVCYCLFRKQETFSPAAVHYNYSKLKQAVGRDETLLQPLLPNQKADKSKKVCH